ncbi:MAG: DUF455 family protein [Verrucomicrobiales bacterium]|nr:DUF455 family protein [Verrucomicrobiales bacterium]
MSTIRQFAERVLFATTLDEKLAAPDGVLTDEGRGGGIASPDTPARPDMLRVAGAGERSRFPKLHDLEKQSERGRLLHFFCNHELLATELMALALLKFPDAPAEFRRGLLRTLREEQEHTRWYLERMAQCGVAFGEHPVSGFFWRSIAPMSSPLDYVARLSLTFEQANLDYARHYASLFTTLGDAPTATLLGQIYKDEIAHVGYGLKWFRRWKEQDRSDWDALCDVLPFPLSPARAKGNAPFNAEGRKKAGLDADFIAQLDLFSQSRGRTPWVYVFNPTAEAFAVPEPAAAAEPALETLAEDLDSLAFFLARSDDVVLLRRKPRPAFLRGLKALGVELAEWELLAADGTLAADSRLPNRKLGRLRPWGWSADSVRLLEPLFNSTGGENMSGAWSDAVRRLYAKSASAELLTCLKWQEAFGNPDIVGRAVSTLPEAHAALEALWDSGHRAVVKSSYGLAGRRMARFSRGTDQAPLPALVEAAGGAVVEPWLERLADFSVHYEVEPGGTPRLKGFVRLCCADSGRFESCAAGPHFTRMLPVTVARFLQAQGEGWLKTLYGDELPSALRTWIGGSGFRGMLGIDAFFYRDGDSAVRLKPIVEINPRCTMGRLTMELRRLADPGRTVQLRIVSKKQVREAGCPSLVEYARKVLEQHPLHRGRVGIEAGAFFLNDPEAADAFLGEVQVRSRFDFPSVDADIAVVNR